MNIKRKTNNKIVAAKKRAAAIKAADDPRTWAHSNPIKKDRGDYYEYIYTIDPNKLYYGCPGAYFISMGNNVEDPWIEWEGWLYNAVDLEDALYSDFGEWLTQSTEAEAQTFDGEFEDWVTPDLVENVLYDLDPFAKVVYDKGNNHTARGVSPTEWFNDNMNIDAACGERRASAIKASTKIEWEVVDDCTDDDGTIGSYGTKVDGKFYWVSLNENGKWDIEKEYSYGIASLGSRFENFKTAKAAQRFFENYIDDLAEEDDDGIESACGKKAIKSSRRKPVKAAYEERRSFDAYGYNEDGDLEYEGLPYALDSIDEVTAWLKAMLDGVEEFKSQWSEWGGDTSELEMFSGPDDAENFGADMYSDIIQNGLEPIAKKLGDMLDVYIYP